MPLKCDYVKRKRRDRILSSRSFRLSGVISPRFLGIKMAPSQEKYKREESKSIHRARIK